MEDNDDYEPDSSGHLDLKYRGWTDIQLNIWAFTHSLLYLDLSFNSIQHLPENISEFHLLQELNCSCNKLQSLPISIGTFPSLRVIKANGNQLTTIPNEISQCKALEQLILSENHLTSLPLDIAGCTSLRSLLLQNNDLCRLPLSLASLSGKIVELDLSNNNQQLTTTLPTQIHRDVDSIMWILALQQEKRHFIDQLKREIKVLQHDIVGMEEKLSEARSRIALLEERRKCLIADMESVKIFLVVRAYSRRVRRWMLRMWEESKQAFSRRL